jgi:hypothetical protein
VAAYKAHVQRQFWNSAPRLLVEQHRTQREIEMPDKRNISSDRKRVAGGQEHEVKYAAKKMGTSKAEVKKAVKEAGNSRAKVEGKLKGE